MRLATCDACSRRLWTIVDKNRYADLLYLEYRNPAVHGLEVGMKTSGRGLSTIPGYMNYRYTIH